MTNHAHDESPVLVLGASGKTGRRVVERLQARGEEEAQRSEEIVKEAGIDWTILRSSWFSHNFSEGTGPRLMTFGDAVREVAEATGRDLRFQTVSMEEFGAGLGELGLSDREPRDFRDYARDTAATGVWDA